VDSKNHVVFNLWNICFLDYLLFLIAFSYFNGTEKAKKKKKKVRFEEILNYITLSLSESKIKTVLF
jgi:hypothetical protein